MWCTEREKERVSDNVLFFQSFVTVLDKHAWMRWRGKRTQTYREQYSARKECSGKINKAKTKWKIQKRFKPLILVLCAIRTRVAGSRHKHVVVFAQIFRQYVLQTSVTLVPVKGFRVPKASTSVKIKKLRKITYNHNEQRFGKKFNNIDIIEHTFILLTWCSGHPSMLASHIVPSKTEKKFKTFGHSCQWKFRSK